MTRRQEAFSSRSCPVPSFSFSALSDRLKAQRSFSSCSFHVAEALQLGLLPVVVHTDAPWIPYATRVEAEAGFVSSVYGLPWLLLRLSRKSDAEIEAREARARRLAASHFGLGGLSHQIGAFLLDRPTDLECTLHPPTVRDAEASFSALALWLGAMLVAAVACRQATGCRRSMNADASARTGLLRD